MTVVTKRAEKTHEVQRSFGYKFLKMMIIPITLLIFIVILGDMDNMCERRT